MPMRRAYPNMLSPLFCGRRRKANVPTYVRRFGLPPRLTVGLFAGPGLWGRCGSVRPLGRNGEGRSGLGFLLSCQVGGGSGGW